MDTAWIISAAALAISGLNAAVTFGVLIFKSGRGYKEELSGVESRITQTIAEVAKDLEEKADANMKNVGSAIEGLRETIALNRQAGKDADAALLDHVRRVEIWARDYLVEKSDFDTVIVRIETSVREHGTRAEASISQLRTDILALVGARPGA